ncbi:MAG: hypothetical protein V2I57_03765 [Xanthomonadales bacterium]|jgi:hypothetical protein|nr:hypothetical protein [Xanthomonadales bacterium]
MRFRRLTPRARSRFLASGLLLIGLSTTASLLSPDRSASVPPGFAPVEEVRQTTLPARPTASLAAEVPPGAQRIDHCPSAG